MLYIIYSVKSNTKSYEEDICTIVLHKDRPWVSLRINSETFICNILLKLNLTNDCFTLQECFKKAQVYKSVSPILTHCYCYGLLLCVLLSNFCIGNIRNLK